MLNTTAIKNLGAVRIPVPGCETIDMTTTAYYECLTHIYTQTIWHPVGTCKMGPKSDAMAVVDHKLRVHGIKRLRVIDASIMPHITTGNTNAPTTMIAEKAADLIKRSCSKCVKPSRPVEPTAEPSKPTSEHPKRKPKRKLGLFKNLRRLKNEHIDRS